MVKSRLQNIFRTGGGEEGFQPEYEKTGILKQTAAWPLLLNGQLQQQSLQVIPIYIQQQLKDIITEKSSVTSVPHVCK